jgi:hypothetical protein
MHRGYSQARPLLPYAFSVSEETFYGGVFSDGEPDALFAGWRR